MSAFLLAHHSTSMRQPMVVPLSEGIAMAAMPDAILPRMEAQRLFVLARVSNAMHTMVLGELRWRLNNAVPVELDGIDSSDISASLLDFCRVGRKEEVELLLTSAVGISPSLLGCALSLNVLATWQTYELVTLCQDTSLHSWSTEGFHGGGFMSGTEALQSTRDAREYRANVLGKVCQPLLECGKIERESVWHALLALVPDAHFGDQLALLTAHDPMPDDDQLLSMASEFIRRA